MELGSAHAAILVHSTPATKEDTFASASEKIDRVARDSDRAQLHSVGVQQLLDVAGDAARAVGIPDDFEDIAMLSSGEYDDDDVEIDDVNRVNRVASAASNRQPPSVITANPAAPSTSTQLQGTFTTTVMTNTVGPPSHTLLSDFMLNTVRPVLNSLSTESTKRFSCVDGRAHHLIIHPLMTAVLKVLEICCSTISMSL